MGPAMLYACSGIWLRKDRQLHAFACPESAWLPAAIAYRTINVMTTAPRSIGQWATISGGRRRVRW
jgi:hypothetical protein